MSTFTPHLPGSNNRHTQGRRIDTYDRAYCGGDPSLEARENAEDLRQEQEALARIPTGELLAEGYQQDDFVVDDHEIIQIEGDESEEEEEHLSESESESEGEYESESEEDESESEEEGDESQNESESESEEEGDENDNDDCTVDDLTHFLSVLDDVMDGSHIAEGGDTHRNLTELQSLVRDAIDARQAEDLPAEVPHAEENPPSPSQSPSQSEDEDEADFSSSTEEEEGYTPLSESEDDEEATASLPSEPTTSTPSEPTTSTPSEATASLPSEPTTSTPSEATASPQTVDVCCQVNDEWVTIREGVSAEWIVQNYENLSNVLKDHGPAEFKHIRPHDIEIYDHEEEEWFVACHDDIADELTWLSGNGWKDLLLKVTPSLTTLSYP